MRSQDQAEVNLQHSVLAPAAHSMHECQSAEEFRTCFESETGRSVRSVIDEFVSPEAPKAIFLTGSIPLGMATNGSDVDFVVLVDGKGALLGRGGSGITNTGQRLAFSNESDPLRVGLFLTVMNGITVEVAVVVTPSIKRVYQRLRSKGPDLSEIEVMTLGRLRTGWLLEWSRALTICKARPWS